MMSNTDRLIELFSEAKARPEGAERDRFLAESCRDDLEMKAQIFSLLDAQERAGDFLANPFGQQETVAAEQPGDTIGAYKLRERLGEGGCGVVYAAEQETPVRRLVALKIIKLGMDTKAVVARFEAERQALAVMDHPNISRVLEAGATDTGRPYFVMELVRGIRITEYCEQNGLSIRERIHLFIQVCQAIQHAHQKGIIHRDIKPSNILVTLHDGVPVPKVIDFGIAKATEGRLTDATVYTHLHQFVGTPAYMSPEQAEMSGLDIDTRTDIYSLGVLLYELLVGCTPFDAKELASSGLDGMRRTIREKEPMRPSTKLTRSRHPGATGAQSKIQNPKFKIDADLDWIVMKCLEKDRKRRYETANGLAADLRRYLANEPVVARPPSTLDRLQKTLRRHKLAFAAASIVAFSLVFALVAGVWQVVKVSRAQGETERKSYVSAMNLARQAWEDHDLARLRRLLENTAEYRDRGFEWYYWQRQAHLDLKTLRGHLGPVVDVSFSPDGERVLTASLDGTARVWDAAQGTQLLRLKAHRRGVSSAAWSPDGLRIVTASEDETAAIWDAASGALLFKFRGHKDRLTSVRFSPDGQHIVTGSFDGSARLWLADTGQEVRAMLHDAAVCSVAFSPDGKRIVTAGKDETAIVWDAATGAKLFSIQAPPAQIPVRPPEPPTFYAAFSPDGSSIVTVSQNQTANLWDAGNGAPLSPIKGNSHFLSPRQTALPLSAGFSPDGRRLIMGGLDFTATVWGLAGGTNLFTLKGHEAEVVSAAFSPDGRRIATGSYDHTAKIWRGTATTETVKLDRQTKVIAGAAFSSDGSLVVTASWDGTAMIWNLAAGDVRTLDHGTSRVWCAAFSLDGTRIVTGTQDGVIPGDRGGSIHVWDVSTGRELMKKNRAHNGEIHMIEFSRDGQRILTAAADLTARVWDAFTGEELQRFEHNYPYVYAAFSPDSRRVATVCGNLSGSWTRNPNTLQPAEAAIWDAETGRRLVPLEPRGNLFSGVAYARDGRFIVAGSVDRIATVWDASTGKMRHTLEGHHAQVITVAISPDSRRIFTGGFDNTTKVWDAAHREELLTLKGGLVAPPGVSPDGQRIVTGPEPPATVWMAASPNQVERWRGEEQAAAVRIAAERRERDAAEEQEQASGIKEWLVLAPIRFEGMNGTAALDELLLPGEADLRPREGERVRAGQDERVWTAVRPDQFRLDFQQLVRNATENSDRCAAYAACYIASETSQSGLTLLVGSDDQAKIYLNGHEVFRYVGTRPWEPDQDEQTGITLKRGMNVLVFKVVNESGAWGGSVRLTDAAGYPVKGIRVTLDPGKRPVIP
jgi:eukaryotic-like serine/threonine-protein kinase